MEELPSTEDIIKKLASPLPICRICLEVSMEYIEFESILCVFRGRQITFYEGFLELIIDDNNLPLQNITKHFCATCGKDLLTAYLFIKRIELANNALKEIRFFIDDKSKSLADNFDQAKYLEAEKGNEICFSNSNSDPGSSIQNQDEIYQEETVENCNSNDSSSPAFDVQLMLGDIEEESQYEYGVKYEHKVLSVEKEELLIEHETDPQYEEQNATDFDLNIAKRNIKSVAVLDNIAEKPCLNAKEYSKCQYCRRVIRKSNMENHLKTHSIQIENNYNCDLCGKTFTTKIGLRLHSFKHTKGNNRYTCNICGKVCMKPFTLRNHIQAKHLSERRKHQCEDCGLFFSFPSLLKEHRRKHNKNNQFKCAHCDRTFMRKPQLDIHIRYHLNDFPYKCNQCEKCYVTKSHLTDHIRSKHTKITYDCDRCKQKFKSQTGLRKHKYAHNGYPYTCPLCSIGQTSRSGMKQHLMGVHKDALTGEEFDSMFPIITPKTGYRRPKQICAD